MAEKLKKNAWQLKPGGKNNPEMQSRSQPAAMPKQTVPSEATNSRFLEASAKMQASVKRHILEYESSSEEEDLEDNQILDSVIVNFKLDGKDFNLGRTKEFLEQSFQSGAVICLVCIASVKRTQPIWNCESCYSAFHLMCIQRWAKDTIYQQSQTMQPNLGSMPVRDNTFKKLQWFCPKCRSPNSEADVPNKYRCFCKKKNDPEFHPWCVPHSCGDICNKPLQQNCGHQCLLLCHPGPCPPCPKMVNLTCNCKQSQPKPIRCSVSSWCCNQKCNKLLDCGHHRCTQQCHPGACNTCSTIKEQSCQCKSFTEKIPCSQVDWQCKKVCGKQLVCGYHKCEQICHKASCGPCPFTGFQKCPCGAVEKEVTCPVEVSSCGGSCNKVLPCGKHICPHKCHKDKCPQCLELVDKKCRCELHVKQLPCSKQYVCETKCKNMKDCGRHPCNKKCCAGDCLPCDKVCGKNLQCGKHKCISVCHRGPCYPCPLTAKVSCRCGRTSYLVPCGRQKKSKPPKCSHNCRIPTPCCHTKENAHKCHFGSCPQCQEKCGKLLYCAHLCSATCHSSVPVVLSTAKADTPCELQQPKIEVRALPCPPCKEVVKRNCLGNHEVTEWPCHLARVSSCGRKCGQPLTCTNHTCSKECHSLVIWDSSNMATECERCNSECNLPRPAGCSHPCKKQCHPAPCEPCSQFLKKSCHCGLTELFLQCNIFTSTDNEKKQKSLSCQQQCIRMLECGHRCRGICHSGVCPKEEMCNRKTKIYCSCRNIKKEVICHLANNSTILCDETCKQKEIENLKALEEEKAKRLLEEQIKNSKEIAEFEKKFGKKKYRQRTMIQYDDDVSFLAKYRIFIISGTVILLSLLLFFFI